MTALIRKITDWCGRKGAAFVYVTLLYVTVVLVRPQSAGDAGMWLTGLFTAFCGANAAITIGKKDPPAT
jgi:hypothetical protein